MKPVRKSYRQSVTKLGIASLAALPIRPSIKSLPTRVQTNDLDLSRDADIAKLFARIYVSALAVCPHQSGWLDAWLEQARNSHFQAVARAVASLNSPKLTSYYEAMIRRQ